MLSQLISGGLSGILGGANKIIGRFVGDKDLREANLHGETMATHQQLAAEFGMRANRTWWDSFWDGLNRAPRPLMACGVIALLIWAPIDPETFILTMRAYALVPEWLALLFGAIVAFYFGARHLEKRMTMKPPSADQIAAAKDLTRDIQASRGQADKSSSSLPSIQAWKKKAKPWKNPDETPE